MTIYKRKNVRIATCFQLVFTISQRQDVAATKWRIQLQKAEMGIREKLPTWVGIVIAFQPVAGAYDDHL
ncbi:MAG: hypothetical protein R3B84_16700 [Zavarzinella sp.]